jgi:hypothetical protein
MPKYFHFHIDTKHMTHHFDAQMHTMRCEYVKQNGERCKNNVIIGQPFCWIHERVGNHLKIAKSLIQDAGLGLFAYNGKDDREVVFKKGEVICPYYGEIIDERELIRRYADKTAPYAIEIKAHEIYEDGALQRGIGSLVNHWPRKKNVRFSVSRERRVNIVALRNIRNGEELYVSYGRGYRMGENGVEFSTSNRLH